MLIASHRSLGDALGTLIWQEAGQALCYARVLGLCFIEKCLRVEALGTKNRRAGLSLGAWRSTVDAE